MSLSAAVVCESIRPYKVTTVQQNSEWGLGYSGQEWWASSTLGGLKRSTDDGLTWIAPSVAWPDTGTPYIGTGPDAGGDVWCKRDFTGSIGWLWDFSAGAWVSSNLPASITTTGYIAHGAGRFITASSTGQMYYSDLAGTTWTAGTNVGGYPIFSFDVTTGYFYLVNGQNGVFRYSSDGITWSTGTPAWGGGAGNAMFNPTSYGNHLHTAVWLTSGFSGPWYNSGSPPSGAATRINLTPYNTIADSGPGTPAMCMWAGTHYFFPMFGSYHGIGWECDSSFANWRLVDLTTGQGASLNYQKPFSGKPISRSTACLLGGGTVTKFA